MSDSHRYRQRHEQMAVDTEHFKTNGQRPSADVDGAANEMVPAKTRCKGRDLFLAVLGVDRRRPAPATNRPTTTAALTTDFIFPSASFKTAGRYDGWN